MAGLYVILLAISDAAVAGPAPTRVFMSDVMRVPESRCLNCHALMNALGTGSRDLEAKPEPGDVTVCIQCGAVMKLDENHRLRGMTEAEMDELVADRAWMDQVASMVQRVYFVKHAKG